MTLRTSRRLLIAALILSLVLHLATARFVHWRLVQPEEPPERVSLTKRIVFRSRPSAPRPAGKPQPARHPPASVRAPNKLITVPAVSNSRNEAPQHAASAGVPRRYHATAPLSATSAPPVEIPRASPAASPACKNQSEPAEVVDKQLPVISKTARQAGTHGIARVHVILSENAAVTDVKLAGSSRNNELDLEAIAAARASTYRPATFNCKPVPGETDYVVEFVPL